MRPLTRPGHGRTRRARSLQNLRILWKKRRRTRKKMRAFQGAEVVLVAYAKSGRTWLSVMISHLAHQKFGTEPSDLISSSEFAQKYPALPRFFLTADNFAPPGLGERELLDLYAARKVVLLVRDPRDIAVSLYYQLTKRASPLARSVFGIPEDLGEIELYDFVCDERFGMPSVIAWLNRWQRWIDEIPEGLKISYEELRAEPVRILGDVSELIGWSCTDEEIAAAVDFASFDKLKALERDRFFQSRRMQPRDSGDSDTYKVRRGKVGGYREDFTPEQVARLDALVAERLDPRLGYGVVAAEDADKRAAGGTRP